MESSVEKEEIGKLIELRSGTNRYRFEEIEFKTCTFEFSFYAASKVRSVDVIQGPVMYAAMLMKFIVYRLALLVFTNLRRRKGCPTLLPSILHPGVVARVGEVPEFAQATFWINWPASDKYWSCVVPLPIIQVFSTKGLQLLTAWPDRSLTGW